MRRGKVINGAMPIAIFLSEKHLFRGLSSGASVVDRGTRGGSEFGRWGFMVPKGGERSTRSRRSLGPRAVLRFRGKVGTIDWSTADRPGVLLFTVILCETKCRL